MIKIYCIDLRRFDDNNFFSEAYNNASLFRKEKCDKFKFIENKKQSLGAAYLLDEYLKTIGLREKDMSYNLSKYGKPSFASHEDIHFSISHSGNFSIVAFSDIEVGCDIEIVKKVDEKVVDRVLSDAQKKRYEILASDERIDYFFKMWVAKEAISKRDGLGLSYDFRLIEDNDYSYISKKTVSENGDKYYISVYNELDKNPIFVNF